MKSAMQKNVTFGENGEMKHVPHHGRSTSHNVFSHLTFHSYCICATNLRKNAANSSSP